MDSLLREIESIERRLDRRRFLKMLLGAGLILRPALESDDLEFLRRVAATLISADDLRRTRIDVVANVEHLLERSSGQHRGKALQLVAWTRRISLVYGGDRVALRARTSRFVLPQKMSKAISSLCLVAFWGDERALQLIDDPTTESPGTRPALLR